MSGWSCVSAVAATLALSPLLAQRETFDVASIRESQSSGRAMFRQQPSGLHAANTTALDLIKWAFDVIDRDVVGELPGWAKTTFRPDTLIQPYGMRRLSRRQVAP